jgi:hypothetical protein
MKMSHGGGGVRKVPKKCHVLFEWPLSNICACTVWKFWFWYADNPINHNGFFNAFFNDILVLHFPFN